MSVHVARIARTLGRSLDTRAPARWLAKSARRKDPPGGATTVELTSATRREATATRASRAHICDCVLRISLKGREGRDDDCLSLAELRLGGQLGSPFAVTGTHA